MDSCASILLSQRQYNLKTALFAKNGHANLGIIPNMPASSTCPQVTRSTATKGLLGTLMTALGFPTCWSSLPQTLQTPPVSTDGGGSCSVLAIVGGK